MSTKSKHKPMGSSSNVLGYIFVVVSALLLSTGGLGIKWIDMDPIAIAGWRSLFSLPLLAFLMFKTRHRAEEHGSTNVYPLSIAYASMVILYVVATRHTTAANAVLLQFTAPIWIVLFSLATKRPASPSRIDILASGGCLVCLSMIVSGGFTSPQMLGNVAAVGSGISLAAYTLMLACAAKPGGLSRAVRAVLLGNVLVLVVCGPSMFLNIPDAPSELIVLVLLGTFQLGLSYIFYALGVESIGSLPAALIAMLEPVINPLLVAAFLGEHPGNSAITWGPVLLAIVIFKQTSHRWLPLPLNTEDTVRGPENA